MSDKDMGRLEFRAYVKKRRERKTVLEQQVEAATKEIKRIEEFLTYVNTRGLSNG